MARASHLRIATAITAAVLAATAGCNCGDGNGGGKRSGEPPTPVEGTADSLAGLLRSCQTLISSDCKDKCIPVLVRFENFQARTAKGRAFTTWHVDVTADFCCECKPDIDESLCKKCDFDGDGKKDGYLGKGTCAAWDTGIRCIPAKGAAFEPTTATFASPTWTFEWVRE